MEQEVIFWILTPEFPVFLRSSAQIRVLLINKERGEEIG
jgi:hypothetical protein